MLFSTKNTSDDLRKMCCLDLFRFSIWVVPGPCGSGETMPAWMYVGGVPLSGVPADPWKYPDGHMSHYAAGQKLTDQTCGEMARFAARFARLVCVVLPIP